MGIVSQREFKRIRSNLRRAGLSRDRVSEVDKIFHGDLSDSDGGYRGIDKREIERGIKWMRDNKGSHNLSDTHIDTIEEELTKYLRK